MGNKILIQNLAEQLATERHLSQKAADEFVKLFFDTIVSGLEKEKILKIKGWGTFKLVDVDTRESVDVNTGERISIDGHKKVTFLPDNVLKKRVNKPFEQFETVVINDGVDIASMESLDNEVVEAASLEKTKSDEMTLSSVSAAADVVNSSCEPDTSLSHDGAEDRSAHDSKVYEHVIHPMQMQLEIKQDASERSQTAEALGDEKSKNRWLRIVVILLMTIILCVASYFAGYYKILCPDCQTEVNQSETLIRTPVRHSTSSVRIPVKHITDSLTHKNSVRQVRKAQLSKVEEKKKNPVISERQTELLDPLQNYRMISTLETYEMKAGDNLYRLARRYYGSKDFAIYIIRYNHFEDPDLVMIGTKVKIPRLKK